MRPPHGSFAWNELITRDVEAAKRFYGATLGWYFEETPTPDGPYVIAEIGDTPMCGIVSMGQEAGEQGEQEMGSHWFSYIEVDDVDRRLAAVTQNGGQVLRPPFDVPGVGRIAIVEDSTGAVMGWITSQDQPEA